MFLIYPSTILENLDRLIIHNAHPLTLLNSCSILEFADGGPTHNLHLYNLIIDF